MAGELNFGRAAAQLYLSPPALSRQIRALEQIVGCELLRRTTHRVELTLAGNALQHRALEILTQVDEAVSATRLLGGELVARIAGTGSRSATWSTLNYTRYVRLSRIFTRSSRHRRT